MTNDELKKTLLSILIEFRDICDQNSFNYSLLAGTIIGAVRHKGFIPWDDDIDVCMPREDFIKFEKYCLTNQTNFKFITNKTDEKYGYLFAKLSNPKTVLKEHVGNRYNMDIGVNIDLFIYDGLGDNYSEALKKYNKSRFKRELLVAANWKKYSKSKTHSFIYEPARLLLFLISRFVNFRTMIRRIEKIYSDKTFSESEYVGNLCSDRRTKSIISRHSFDDYIELEFEGEKFKVFVGYEEYLKTMYGNYLELPPLEKRQTHHTFDAFFKE